jgi:hypothetical protein
MYLADVIHKATASPVLPNIIQTESKIWDFQE